MKLTFCGAAREVTGSCHLLELDNGLKILLDCGLYQGDDKTMREWNREWPLFNPKDIDYLIVSHAHIDHIGRIPLLVKNGFEGDILCTHATRSLASIMLLDAAKIQEQDADGPEDALYNVDDVHLAMKLFVGVGYERWHPVAEGLSVFFRDAGHILGSASVTLEIERLDSTPVYLGFTGDVGRPHRPILKDPIPMPQVDYLICESTYGNRDHASEFIEASDLLEIIKETCIKNKGKLLIPAFSVGRTQELVYMMDQLKHQHKLPDIPVYVDSPLAINAVHVFSMHPECYDKELLDYMLKDDNPFGFSGLRYVRNPGLADRLAGSPEPCVIISAAGMMNAGRVRRHLYHILPKPENTVLVISYCAPNTIGAKIRSGVQGLDLYGSYREIKAQVKIMDSFSAHADRNELWQFLEAQSSRLKKLFLVHGEYEAQLALKDFFHEKGFQDIEIPALGQEVELG
jgi:metallo-beta-lactamase family protein